MENGLPKCSLGQSILRNCNHKIFANRSTSKQDSNSYDESRKMGKRLLRRKENSRRRFKKTVDEVAFKLFENLNLQEIKRIDVSFTSECTRGETISIGLTATFNNLNNKMTPTC